LADFNTIINAGNNGKVGVGTEQPTQKLDVDGQLRLRGGNPGAGKVLTSDDSGVASWQPVSSFSKWKIQQDNTYLFNFRK